MALRDKLRDRAQRYLEPGEQIQAVWLGQSGPSPYYMFLSYWIVIIGGHYKVFVASDRAILVLDAGKMMPAKPKRLRVRATRQVQLGPCSGLWGQIQVAGTRYWVHKRFHKDIDAADAAMAQGAPGWGVPTGDARHGAASAEATSAEAASAEAASSGAAPTGDRSASDAASDATSDPTRAQSSRPTEAQVQASDQAQDQSREQAL